MAKGWRKPKKQCAAPGCSRHSYARGFCPMHYGRWKKHGDPMLIVQPKKHQTLDDAMKGKFTIPESGCWEWKRRSHTFGYGAVSFQGRNIPAHRAMWILHFGSIPDGLLVCHKCDNPPCVNPDHLFLGTSTDNNRDMLSKGRMKHNHAGKTHCKDGHEFTVENTRLERNGRRTCRACERESGKRKYQRRRNAIATI